MKKIGYLFVIIVFLFIGCNGTPENEKGSSSTKSAADATETVSNKTASAGGKLEHLTDRTFKQKVMDYEKYPKQWVFAGDKPAVVDFYADWCRPCRMIAPMLEELAVEYKGKINIYKVDTEDQRDLAAVFSITSLPTVMFIPLQGRPYIQKGALPKESYQKIIDEHLLKTTPVVREQRN